MTDTERREYAGRVAHEICNAHRRCVFGKKADNVHGAICKETARAILTAMAQARRDALAQAADVARDACVQYSMSPRAAVEVAARIRALTQTPEEP